MSGFLKPQYSGFTSYAQWQLQDHTRLKTRWPDHSQGVLLDLEHVVIFVHDKGQEYFLGVFTKMGYNMNGAGPGFYLSGTNVNL